MSETWSVKVEQETKDKINKINDQLQEVRDEYNKKVQRLLNRLEET